MKTRTKKKKIIIVLLCTLIIILLIGICAYMMIATHFSSYNANEVLANGNPESILDGSDSIDRITFVLDGGNDATQTVDSEEETWTTKDNKTTYSIFDGDIDNKSNKVLSISTELETGNNVEEATSRMIGDAEQVYRGNENDNSIFVTGVTRISGNDVVYGMRYDTSNKTAFCQIFYEGFSDKMKEDYGIEHDTSSRDIAEDIGEKFDN